MASKDTMWRIKDEITKIIDYHTYESIDVTYGELIGVLEAIKFELLTNAYQPDEEETDSIGE